MYTHTTTRTHAHTYTHTCARARTHIYKKEKKIGEKKKEKNNNTKRKRREKKYKEKKKVEAYHSEHLRNYPVLHYPSTPDKDFFYHFSSNGSPDKIFLIVLFNIRSVPILGIISPTGILHTPTYIHTYLKL